MTYYIPLYELVKSSMFAELFMSPFPDDKSSIDSSIMSYPVSQYNIPILSHYRSDLLPIFTLRFSMFFASTIPYSIATAPSAPGSPCWRSWTSAAAAAKTTTSLPFWRRPKQDRAGTLAHLSKHRRGISSVSLIFDYYTEGCLNIKNKDIVYIHIYNIHLFKCF